MMRTPLIIAALFLSVAAAPLAPPPAERPVTPGPQATAPFPTREAWCENYAAWVVSQEQQDGATPADVRPTHQFEVEFNSCKPNPAEYEQQTLAEIDSRQSGQAPHG